MTNSRREFLRIAATSVAVCSTPRLVAAAARSADGPATARDFFAACEQGKVERVRALLKANSELLHVRDEAGRSGFAVSLLARQRAMADYLLEAGYRCDLHEAALALDWERFEKIATDAGDRAVERVNSDHPIGGTAMYAAAAGGAGTNIWRVYAQCGDPNALPRAGAATALQAALRIPDLAVAEMTAATLLANNANPNLVGAAEASPLHIAAARGSLPLVEMLIRLGADAAATDSADKSPADVARTAEHREVAAMLRQHDRIPRTCRTSRTAQDVHGKPYRSPDIHDISPMDRRALVGQAHGNLDYVKDALQRDPRLAHSVATTSEICVEACAHMGRKPIVELLLEHGAPYSLPTAVMRSDYAAVKRMLDEDPQRIHERGAHDFPLLWYPVIGRCELRMIELLLARGAKIEEQNFLGTTVLHWACLRGPSELVRLLLDRGANVNRVGRKFNDAGETPLQMARSSEQVEIAELLLKRGATE